MSTSVPEPTPQQVEAGRWLRIADADTAAATALLDLDPPLAEIAAYHCQQAIEKLAKGVLVLGDIGFRKSHDLLTLAAQVEAAFPAIGIELRALAWVTGWGFSYRYPQEEEEPAPSANEIRAVLARIERIRASAAELIGI